MQVEVNSVWQVSSLDGKDDGLYRVLAIYADKDLLILFHITEDKKLERPISAYLSLFIDLAKKKSITVSEYELPAYLNCKEEDIDGIAYTQGPGLVGALLVGASVGRSLAYAWDVPAIGVHHMEGHLLAPMLEETAPEFPFVALLVSGGHSMLVQVDGIGRYTLLGESIDDAAGEAFDKTAKLLGLDYPGGPLLAKLAEQGEPGHYAFPRPMTDRPGLDFSFSGLKTFAANTIRDADDNPQTRANIAYAFQEAVIDTLSIKCKRALKQTGLKRLVIAGGVSANTELRSAMKKLMQDIRGEVFYPSLGFCTDNGAMIAYAGLQRLKAGQSTPLSDSVKPRWPLDTLSAL